MKANWNFALEFCRVFQKDEFFFSKIFFTLYTIGHVMGDKEKSKVNWSYLNLSIIIFNDEQVH